MSKNKEYPKARKSSEINREVEKDFVKDVEEKNSVLFEILREEEKYPMKEHRSKDGFLEYAKKVRKESKEFFDACGTE